MRRSLATVDYEEMKGKNFTEIRVDEKLCEVCDKPIRAEEKTVKTIEITDYERYSNLLTRQKAHDRVEVDLEENKIYVYHHDYPGEIHPSCIEKL
ncbi:MAG TPA: hypothetical protein VJ249_09110 [Candidatus Bathyarchaeia archaeon]|nr:hypothetical protein [Candidatus Bathyarchaeia archaeon]